MQNSRNIPGITENWKLCNPVPILWVQFQERAEIIRKSQKIQQNVNIGCKYCMGNHQKGQCPANADHMVNWIIFQKLAWARRKFVSWKKVTMIPSGRIMKWCKRGMQNKNAKEECKRGLNIWWYTRCPCNSRWYNHLSKQWGGAWWYILKSLRER